MRWMFDRRLVQNFDWPLALTVLALSGVGLLAIYSATAPGAPGAGRVMVIKQAFWFSLGLILMVGAFLFHYSWLDRYVWWIYGLSVGSLVYVLILGKTVSGSTRWIGLGPFSIQPSEFAKIAVVLVLAHEFSKRCTEPGLSLKDLLWPAVWVGIPFVLILKEPDLGTGLLLVLIAGTMTLFAKIERKSLLWLCAWGACGIPAVWWYLKDYQKQRILTFLSPDSDPLGAGYHITQSKIAIGSGMLSGKGYLEGTQKALAFLPEQHTDFVFSVIAEETGLLGGTILLAGFGVLLVLGLKVAFRSKDVFGATAAVGLVAMIFWQVFINMGMVMGLMPVVGMTLPLVSYGGSSLLTTMLGLGILLNISMRRYMFDQG